ncbi:monovalent cation/H(+) antiporter subunit G [Marimonas sp. MJW-29]|uniref:Monovalent cation/H(+) antiporter subunit G n=1 Tax=Sulfitobacter sediminis TaxID=3234186 RepID=A0ABV3RN13_9RHOB
MSLEVIGTYAVGISLLIGAGFALVGTIGLLKFNDSMTRLHAPTKVGTIGIGMLLLASMIHAFVFGDGSFHEVLIMAFLFVTAPISANFIAKVNIHRRSCETPPPPPQDDTWSTLNVPEADRELAAPEKG